MQKEMENRKKEKARLRIIDEVIKKSNIVIPEIMLERTLDNMVEEYKAYVQDANKEIPGDLREKLKEKAEKDVSTNLVLYQIAKEKNLEPSQKEVEEEVNKFLAHSQLPKDQQIDPQKLYDYSYGIVKNRKVFEYLESLK